MFTAGPTYNNGITIFVTWTQRWSFNLWGEALKDIALPSVLNNLKFSIKNLAPKCSIERSKFNMTVIVYPKSLSFLIAFTSSFLDNNQTHLNEW
jgi:hypothetical protein